MLLVYICSIQALLSAPNPDDPLAENVAKHWKDNEQEAVATGKDPKGSWCCARYIGLHMSRDKPAKSSRHVAFDLLRFSGQAV